MESTDAQLVARAQQGDLQALGELIELHRRMAFAVAYTRLGNAEDAHDAAQEAFIEAFRALPGLADAAKFRPWLTTIIIRRCAGIMKTRRRQADLVTRAGAQLTAASVTAENSAAVLPDRLPKNDHRLLTLSALDGYSYTEIAAQLGISTSAVRSRIHRARLRLYQEVFPMADAATLYLSRDVIERVLLRLTSAEQPFTADGLKSTAERATDEETATIVNGLAWLLEHGESLELALFFTGIVPPGLTGIIRLGQETGRSEMMFRAAAALLREGLLQPQSPVSNEEAANFFAYFTCMLQAGVPLFQAMTMAGAHVPSLTAVATAIYDAWKSRQSIADALRNHPVIFTESCISLLSLAESTGKLDAVAALLAALLWEPEMMLTLRSSEKSWEERLRRAEEIMRAQQRFKE